MRLGVHDGVDLPGARISIVLFIVVVVVDARKHGNDAYSS